MKSFSNETEMEDAYMVAQEKDLELFVVAVIFEQYNATDTIKYKIRHSKNIPNTLYLSALGRNAWPTMYFDTVPIVQIQMCVDRVLINEIAPNSMSNIKVKIFNKEYVILSNSNLRNLHSI